MFIHHLLRQLNLPSYDNGQSIYVNSIGNALFGLPDGSLTCNSYGLFKDDVHMVGVHYPFPEDRNALVLYSPTFLIIAAHSKTENFLVATPDTTFFGFRDLVYYTDDRTVRNTRLNSFGWERIGFDSLVDRLIRGKAPKPEILPETSLVVDNIQQRAHGSDAIIKRLQETSYATTCKACQGRGEVETVSPKTIRPCPICIKSLDSFCKKCNDSGYVPVSFSLHSPITTLVKKVHSKIHPCTMCIDGRSAVATEHGIPDIVVDFLRYGILCEHTLELYSLPVERAQDPTQVVCALLYDTNDMLAAASFIPRITNATN